MTIHAIAAPEPEPGIDHDAAERAATGLLAALGADPEDESLRDTPRRMARLYAELLTPAPFNATTFPNDGGYDELVVARSIPFHSLCEHHLLPFAGVAHVGYLPGDVAGQIEALIRSRQPVDVARLRDTGTPLEDSVRAAV